MTNIIYTKANYRIIELPDEHYFLDDLKGDCFDPEVNPDNDPIELKKQEREFEREVQNLGVFGYVLEKWYPEVNQGWIPIESCWGFIGNHKEKEHYIVDELKKQIKA